MSKREILRAPSFERDLTRLSRRHPGLTQIITEALDRYATEEPSARYRQQGVGGLPVFKERLPLPGVGKRRGVRLIFYRDDERVIALFAYAKSATALIPEKAIRKALASAGITETPEPWH
ncbi:MAG: hypothetical protein OXI57_11870 [Rhodospirillales bacterium]|nr:hypothetical protein [Rhodospirillales bacterium]